MIDPIARTDPSPGVYLCQYRDGSHQVTHSPDDETVIQAAKATFGDLNEIVSIRLATTGHLVWSQYLFCDYLHVSTNGRVSVENTGVIERRALVEHSDDYFADHGITRIYDEDGLTLWVRP